MSLPRPATAPVSFGIFGSAATEHSPADVVGAMAAAGFDGAELGPPGLFGTPDECAALFARHELTVVGAYVGLHLAGDDEQFRIDRQAFERSCEELATAAPGSFVILADEGDERTRANPARSADDPIRWSEADWSQVAGRVDVLLSDIVEAGLTPSFHPHIGTYVENAREVELLLERTAVDLTLDTGHFLMAGIDPVVALRDYGSRINHLHAKDVRLAGVPPREVTHRTDLDDWWGDISSPLGEGDVDLEAFVAAVPADRFRWIVIEQDRDPAPAGSLDPIGRVELANRRHLEQLIAEHACDRGTHLINKGETS